MARSIWNGSLAFGLVDIPVKVVPAVREKDVKFRWIHAKDGAPVEIRRVCSADGEEVPWDEILRGYPLGDEEYVALTREEVREAQGEGREDIGIEEFVEAADLDAIYMQRPYWLVPDEGGERAYRVLVEAMRETGRVALARMTLRGKDRLVAIRPLGEGLVLVTLLYHDEVASAQEVGAGATGSPDVRELALAERIIDALTAPFEPERYADRARERVLALVEGRRAVGEAAPAPLLEALAATLESVRREKAREEAHA